MIENITMEKVTSRLSETFTTEVEGYKATTNIVVVGGKIESLSGNIYPANGEGEVYDSPRFHAYKKNGKWYTDVNGASNDEQDLISDIAVAIVNKVVAEYDSAE